MQTLDGGPGRTDLRTDGSSSGPWVVGILAAVAVVVLAIIAILLLTGGDDTVAVSAENGSTPTLDEPGGLDPATARDAVGGQASDDSVSSPSATGATGDQGASVDLLGGDLELALDDLEAAIGREAQLAEITIYDTYAIVEYRSAGHPDNIDRVVWRDGAVEQPEPVGFTEDYADALFRVGQVDLTTIPDLIERALDEFDLTGGEVTHVIVDRFFGLDDEVAIRVYVSNPDRGGGGYLLARSDGTVVDVVG